MRKKRWKKVLIWTASVIVLLGIGGLFAANYAMDRLIASLADSLEGDLLADVVPDTNKPSGTGEPVETEKPSDNEGSDDGGQSEDPNTVNSGNSNQTAGTSGELEYSAEVSTDKARDVQDKITVGEKARLATVFMKELSADDIKKLQSLASGGLSTAEKKEARTLILDRLSPEQYDDLIGIAKKYGMSQGKSYAEVSKEK